jgi:integrase
VAGDGSRRTVRLGKVSKAQAEHVKVKIEGLVTARLTGRMEDEIARWLAALDDKVYAKLVRVGLADPRTSAAPAPAPEPVPSLGAFVKAYAASRTDLKPSTKRNYEKTVAHLLAFFDADKPIDAFTPGDADRWCLYLKTKLKENTVRLHCSHAKRFFRSAMRNRLIAENPFADAKTSYQRTYERKHFVTRQEAERILAACPNWRWRTIFALCRYGAVRCPSELLTLKWTDVNWEQSRILIHSPKTEHHPGQDARVVPLFPELVSHLREAFEEAEPGAVYVVPRWGKTGNLRAQFAAIVKAAGLQPWPKIFNALRSWREIELRERWPSHVVCSWLGHSEDVAEKHYLCVTEAHFRQAAEPETAHETAQQPSAADCDELQPAGQSQSVDADLQHVAACGTTSHGGPGVLQGAAGDCLSPGAGASSPQSSRRTPPESWPQPCRNALSTFPTRSVPTAAGGYSHPGGLRRSCRSSPAAESRICDSCRAGT